MTTRWLSGMLVLAAAALVGGAEPPPWQRLLQGDDARKAAALDTRIGNLFAAGQFAEAVGPAEEALALRRRVQGDDHWQTANARLLLQAAKEMAALPADARADLQEANRLSGQADALSRQGRPAEAEPLLREALAIDLRVRGEDQRATAQGCNNLALNLDAQGRYAEAEPLHRRALAICRRALPETNRTTLETLVNLATNLDGQGRHAEAQPLYEKALDLARPALGERDELVVGTSSHLASCLYRQGRYADAERLLRQAVDVSRQARGEDSLWTASLRNNLAVVLLAEGKPAEAEPLARAVLDVHRRFFGEESPQAALRYTTLAGVLHWLGRYDEAEALWTKAADRFEVARLGVGARGLERATFEPDQEPSSRLAACLARNGKPAAAWQRLEAGLGRGLLDDLSARPLRADERRRGQELQEQRAQLDNRLIALLSARALSDAGRARVAELRQQRDAVQTELTRLQAEAAGHTADLATVQRHLPDDAALVAWVDYAAGPGAADPRGEHWACIVRRSGPPAWVRLPGTGANDAWTDEDHFLPGRLRVALVRRSPGWSNLADRLRAQRLDPLRPQLAATADLPAVGRLVVVPAGWMAGVPLEALTDRYAVSYTPSGTVFARLAEGHRPLHDPSLLALGDPAFADRAASPAPPLPDHGLLILQVLPGSAAERAGLRTGDVLLRYGDTDLAALTGLRLKTEGEPVPVRVWRDGRTRDLAVAPGKLGVLFHREPAPVALKQRQEAEQLLASTRGPAPKPLPGTRREVQAIAGLFPPGRAELLLGRDASARRLDELTGGHRLKDFRVLHFATHGVIDMGAPERSALLLADAEARGRLEVGTLAGWQLDADLVVLSACDTGLGRQAGGEGFLGFTQALFGAGARSLVLSLWEVDDTATALLMTRFYENLLGKRDGLKAPLGRAEALREAQAWLRDLPRPEAEALAAKLTGGTLRGTLSTLKPAPAGGAGEPGDRPYAHPYYWSAFVLLGDPD
jgi:tetratricopeptide (TPR) repeat protein